MILSVSIYAYEFEDLNNEAKQKVIYWLDQDPLEFEREDGSMGYQYFSEGSENDIKDHCFINNYRFDKYGNPIHQLTL